MSFRAKGWFHMPKKVSKSAFGLALAHILLDKGLSQQDLERYLGTAEGLVSKYSLLPAQHEWQKMRIAPADFVYRVVKVLELNDEQEAELIKARHEDVIWKFKEEYNEIDRRKQENASKERVNVGGIIYVRQK